MSWQYHSRREENWQVFEGSAGIIRSNTDAENEMKTYSVEDQIVLQQGERHHLIGLSVFAEIWQMYKGST